MKTIKSLFAVSVLAITLHSCHKCHECHYEDASNNEVDLGEFCDDELEAKEKEGHTIDGVKYDVHCHDH